MNNLGVLEKVALRDIWKTEAQAFTPWLAQEENLAQLGQTIGIELELEAQEKDVGPFRADLLCKDTATGDWVLIENQIERTDHTHLGQLLTYAAGLQAVTIVWIAATFTEEHRATLDWLNKITDENFQFFGLEVELWKIGTSPAAPKFNIISKPNDWTKAVSQAAHRIASEGLSELNKTQVRYWEALAEKLILAKSSLQLKKARPQNWANFSIGRSGFSLAATINSKLKRLGVEIYINGQNAKEYFKILEAQKNQIEADAKIKLEWQELPEKIASRIILYKENEDPLDESRWGVQQEWIKTNLELFDRVFRPVIREISLPSDEEFSEQANA